MKASAWGLSSSSKTRTEGGHALHVSREVSGSGRERRVGGGDGGWDGVWGMGGE